MVNHSAADGIQFPLESNGQRGSTTVGKQILFNALSMIDPAAALAVQQESKWRTNYPRHFYALVAAGIRSPENAVRVAQEGLNESWRQFEFVRQGTSYTLANAMESLSKLHFQTLTFKGQGAPDVQAWHVPYQGKLLQGEALSDQLLIWEKAGVIEPSNRIALQRAIEHPEWFDLSDRTLVLFGAGSEAGPLTWLAKWRANIVGIDLPRPEIWQKIIQIVKAGNATLLMPTTSHGLEGKPIEEIIQHVGCNLLTETPEVAEWLNTMPIQLDLAAIAYLDGEKHVRISMAMDAVISAVSEKKSNSTLMYMATPTDVFAVTAATAEGVNQRYQKRSAIIKLATRAIDYITQGRYFKQHIQPLSSKKDEPQYGIVDCLVVEQGPNYALAKRIQQWRAVLARSQGQRVSINVAPSTTTNSVVKNPLLKAAFAGAHLYQVESFSPETTNALMAALWVHDMRSEQSAANPDKFLSNPLELIMENANHGGLWRSPYLPRTVLPMAAVFGWLKGKVKH